jgi:hypothetical protein
MAKIILARPPRTEDELWWVIKAFFGVALPRAVHPDCVEKGHVSPFHAVAHAFFSRPPNFAVWYASRGSGKSLALAVLGLVKSFVWDVDVTILGGSMTQSRNVAEHMRVQMSKPNAPRFAMQKNTATELRLHTQKTIRPLPASQTTVRGPHPPLQLLDEIDEMEMAIYDAAMGQAMPQENHWGYQVPEYIVASSTWQNPEGTMTEVIDKARKEDQPIFTWCWRELLKTADNPWGWMTQRQIDVKRKAVSAIMWKTEYELNEPSGASRAFDLEQLEKCFIPYPMPVDSVDKGDSYKSWTWEKPLPNGQYRIGADWAKENDFTVISVVRVDQKPYRMAKLIRVQKMPYPVMIGFYNREVQAYHAYAEHDRTGLGNVVDDYIEWPDQSNGFVLIGRPRTEMLLEYIAAVEHGDYELPTDEVLAGIAADGSPVLAVDDAGKPLKLDGLDRFKRAHRATTVADVYAPGKWDSHLPDDVCSMALEHRALVRSPAPISEDTSVPREDQVRKVDKPFHEKPYAEGFVTRSEGGVTVIDERYEDTGLLDMLVRSDGTPDTGLWTPSDY